MPGSPELPSITVVTPCLDAARTLAETIESVRTQDYPRVEHLVIDGGSTDGTLELLERTEGVRWTSEPDRGLPHAFNKGVRAAGGEVIAWLNADDAYEPGALRAAAGAFAANPGSTWVAGRCRIVDAGGREVRRAVTAYRRLLLRRCSFRLLLTHNFVMAPATFVRRDVLGEAPLDERFRYSADYDLWLRLAAHQPPVVLDRVLTRFRMAEGSLSMAGFERQFAEHAQNAREHGDGHRVAVAANALASRLIPLAYRTMRAARSARSR